MGVIRQLADRDADGDEPRPQTAPHSSDPFLNEFDFTKVKVDDQTADRMLGLLVVISNLTN